MQCLHYSTEYSTVQSADILSSYHGNFLSAADWLNCFHPPSIIFYRNVHTVPGLTQLHSKWKIKPAWHLDIENKYWYPILMRNGCWHNLVLNSMISSDFSAKNIECNKVQMKFPKNLQEWWFYCFYCTKAAHSWSPAPALHQTNKKY